MNKEDVACISLIALIAIGATTVIFYIGLAEKENYYDLNISTENKVFLKAGSINTWGNMVWDSNWSEIPYNRRYRKTTELGVKFKEYVYADGFYEIVYSDSFYFTYESLLDNDGVAYIVLENATITIAIV